MSSGDRQSVLRTTKVRTLLKGDNSWIQRRAAAQEEQEEKPWMAEVKGTRTNVDEPNPTSPPTSPVHSPVSTSPTSKRPKSPSIGYMIRGVFKKTGSKKSSSPGVTNGTSKTSNFTPKKPSDTYKKIAPHSVRTAAETSAPADTTLSPEEQDRRTEAASNVLRSSAARQRNYVLSAAKKYESSEKTDRQSPNSVPFVAKRVEINEEESAPADTQNDVTPRVPTPEDSVPQRTEQLSHVETQKVSPAPSPSDPDSTEDLESASVPDTEASPATISQEVEAEADPLPSDDSGTEDLTLTESPQVEADPAPATSDDLENDLLTVTESPQVKADPPPAASDDSDNDLVTVTQSPQVEADPAPAASDDLENDLLTVTESPQVEADPAPAASDDLENDLLTVTESPQVEADPAPAASDDLENDLLTVTESPQVKADRAPAASNDLGYDDLRTLAESAEVSVDPVPSSTDTQYSHDLLSGPTSQSDNTESSLEKLAIDVIPMDTNRDYLSTSRQWKYTHRSSTEEKPAGSESPELSVDPSPSRTDNLSQTVTKTVRVTERKTDFDDLISTKSTTRTIESPSETVKTTSTKSVTERTSILDDYKSPKDTEDSLSEPLVPLRSREKVRSWETSDDSYTDRRTETIITTVKRREEREAVGADDAEDDRKYLEPRTSRLRSWRTSLPPEIEDTEGSYTNCRTETIITTVKKREEREAVGADDAEDDRKYLEPRTSRLRSWRTSLPSEIEDTEGSYTNRRTETIITTVKKREEREAVGADDAEADRKEPEPRRPSPALYDRTLESPRQELSPHESKKSFVYVKEYVNSELEKNDGNEYLSSRSSNYSYSSPPISYRNCTYCSEPVGSDAKITIEDLNIYCHPSCFKCGVCSKPMGDLLFSMFLHNSVVHCETCYSNIL